MQNKKCPVCNNDLSIIPSGVSKTSGKPYNSFYSCKNRCNLKGLMDTRVKTDPRPVGWDKLGEKLGKETDFGKTVSINQDFIDLITNIDARTKKILDLLNKEMPDEDFEIPMD